MVKLLSVRDTDDSQFGRFYFNFWGVEIESLKHLHLGAGFFYFFSGDPQKIRKKNGWSPNSSKKI